MNPKKTAFLIIVISIVFAVAIVLAEFLLAKSHYSHYSEMVRYSLVALWWIPFSILSIPGTKK